jgi:hypothetical protein
MFDYIDICSHVTMFHCVDITHPNGRDRNSRYDRQNVMSMLNACESFDRKKTTDIEKDQSTACD